MTKNSFLDRITEMLANVLFNMCSASNSNSFDYVELYQALKRANEKGFFGAVVAPIMPFEFEGALVELQRIECLTWRDKDNIDADLERLSCVVQTFNHISQSKQVPEFVD